MLRMIFSLALATAFLPAAAQAGREGEAEFAESVGGARQALQGLEDGGLGRSDVIRIRAKINREIQRLAAKIEPLQKAYDMQSTLCYFKSPAQKNGCDDFVDQLGYRLQNLKGFRDFLEDLLLELQ